MILAPANDAGNVISSVKAIVLPMPETDDPAPPIMHWLLPSVPDPLSGMDPAYPSPALLIRYNVHVSDLPPIRGWVSASTPFRRRP